MSTLEDVVRLLPDYELGAELGRGNFGVVWRARHRQLERDAAVKQLAAPTVGDDSLEARFRREARLLASLDHPHVVRGVRLPRGRRRPPARDGAAHRRHAGRPARAQA